MNPRNRLLTAMRRGIPDRVPYVFGFTPTLFETFKQKTGRDKTEDYFEFDVRYVGMKTTKRDVNVFKKYFKDLPANAEIGEWGYANVPGTYYHFSHWISPLTEITDVKEIENYPFPDYDADYRYEGVKEQVEEYKNKGFAVGAVTGFSTFDFSWLVRGIDSFMMDMLVNEDFAQALTERVCYLLSYYVRKMVEAGVDIIGWGEDVGTQKGLMMSPATWRKWIKPSFRKMIETAKSANPNVLAFYHSDGNIEEIIPELIEIGVDILNPIQPECMDPAKLKKLYGDKLAFWGSVSTQKTMPFGSPKDVEDEVRERIQTVGRNGGFLIAPTHTLEPEVPWENVMAFVDAVHKYGKY